MSQYYYTVASLPLLLYETEKSVSCSAFLEICEQQLIKQDYALIMLTSLSKPSQNEIKNRMLKDWFIWEMNLRNELVKLRAQRLGIEADNYLRSIPEILGAEEIARNALSQGSPLTAEEILNQARWDYLDELEIGHYFDIEKLIIYYLRLQILKRKEQFTKETGTAHFNDVYEKVSQISDE